MMNSPIRPTQSADKPRPSLYSYLLVMVVALLPRLTQLDLFLTPDEPLFLDHAQRFMAGLTTGDFNQTLGIGYPSVTLAWWSGLAIWLLGPDETMTLYAAGRLANGLAITAMLLLVYHLARRLWGEWPALIGVVLLALDPYTLGYSRLLHIATPLALLMTLTGLAHLLWLHEQKSSDLCLTGLMAGLALLTKSTALLLLPMLLMAHVGYQFGHGISRRDRFLKPVTSGLRPHLRSVIAPYALIILIAMLTFALLWPAMWVQPLTALQLTFGKLLTDQAAGTGNLGLFWLGQFVEDPGPLFYPVALLLKSTPWLLVGLMLSAWGVIRAAWYVIRGESSSSHIVYLQTHIPLWLFALTYLMIMTVASKKSIRYLLPAIPIVYLLAGLAYATALKQVKSWANQAKRLQWLHPPPSDTKLASPKGRVGLLSSRGLECDRFSCRQKLATAKAVALQISARFWQTLTPLPLLPPTSYLLPPTLLLLFLLPYHPYYLSYYNPLVQPWLNPTETLLVGWGEGLDQAADYLSDQAPNATVTAWYSSLFAELYDGSVQDVVPPENFITTDYTVLYINQLQRNIPDPNLIVYFHERRQPERTVRLNGLDYVWIYPQIAGFARVPQPQQPLIGNFGDVVTLLGYDISASPRSGEPLIVTLYWRSLTSPSSDYFVFMRLLDEQGQVWAKQDSPPVMGFWPTTRWQPNMVIEDAHALPIPAGTPAGDYRLEVGLYEPNSGQPLAASGQPIGPGGGLVLGDIPVEWHASTSPSGMPHELERPLTADIKLRGHTALPEAAQVGEVISLGLLWQRVGGTDGARDGERRIEFRWQRPAGQADRAEQDSFPMPLAEWTVGSLLRSQHRVLLPPTLPAGRHTLLVTLGEEPFPLGQVAVSVPPRTFEPPTTLRLPTDETPSLGAVDLLGYQLERTDRMWSLNLYWQPQQPLPQQQTVFVQLLDADNHVMAQSDQIPAQGSRPTTSWLAGEIITDRHTLALADRLPAGRYRLISGLYNRLTGNRLVDEQGKSFILITEINVEP